MKKLELTPQETQAIEQQRVATEKINNINKDLQIFLDDRGVVLIVDGNSTLRDPQIQITFKNK
jgi:hypothetical protein